jgi:hypothetical protein
MSSTFSSLEAPGEVLFLFSALIYRHIFSLVKRIELLRWTMRRMMIWKSNTTTMKLSYASRRRRKRWGGCSWEKEVEAEGHTFAMCGCSGMTPAQGGSIDNPSEEFKTRCEQYVGVYGGNKKYTDDTRERKQCHFCSRKGTYSYCYGCRRFLCSELPLNGKDRRVPKVLQYSSSDQRKGRQ